VASLRIRPLPTVAEVWSDLRCPSEGCGGTELHYARTLLGGGHVVAELRCQACGTTWFRDLPVGHGATSPFWYEPATGRLVGGEGGRNWFGAPFLEGLRAGWRARDFGLAPDVQLEVRQKHERAIVLYTPDAIWGHVFLKLANAEAHLQRDRGWGLVVVVPKFARWLVPDGVAEVWTVDVPTAHGRRYFADLDASLNRELARFVEVRVSPAHSHPFGYDATRLTRVPSFAGGAGDSPLITFVWRDDRLWLPGAVPAAAQVKLLGKGGRRARGWLGHWQARRVADLFARLGRARPGWRFAVAGLGDGPSLPSWISDRRVARYTDDDEHAACRTYAESALVIGVQGSHMLLPSAHAGAMLDLVPQGRWGNLAHDVVYRRDVARAEPGRRSRTHRYLAAESRVAVVADAALDAVAALGA